MKVTEPQLRGGHLEEPVLLSAEAPKLGDISLNTAWQTTVSTRDYFLLWVEKGLGKLSPNPALITTTWLGRSKP